MPSRALRSTHFSAVLRSTIALHMSAFDPKRTLFEPLPGAILASRFGHRLRLLLRVSRSQKMVRGIAVLAVLSSALPAMAGEMSASEARYFVTGKLFSYTCFDGTRGLARVHLDGSVDGSIQLRGTGRTQYGTMPAATLRVYGERVCASLPRSIIQPCFYLERTSTGSFRGSISGFGFAYCDFTQYEQPTRVVHSPRRQGPSLQTSE